MVRLWVTKRSCTRKELESFLGHLAHAAIVMRPGRTFLRHLFSLLHSRYAPHDLMLLPRPICIGGHRCFSHGMGLPSFLEPLRQFTFTPTLLAHTAAGWFKLAWPGPASITVKELVPVVLASAVWGPYWSGLHICFHSDNSAMVALLRNLTSRDHVIMHLIRCLSFFAALFRFDFTAAHMPGASNVAADALSRNNIPFSLPTDAGDNGTSRADVPPAAPQTRLGINSLDQTVWALFASGIAPATRAAYDSSRRRYIYQFGLTLSETVLCHFIAFLFAQSLSARSIRFYLSALHYSQISLQTRLLPPCLCCPTSCKDHAAYRHLVGHTTVFQLRLHYCWQSIIYGHSLRPRLIGPCFGLPFAWHFLVLCVLASSHAPQCRQSLRSLYHHETSQLTHTLPPHLWLSF